MSEAIKIDPHELTDEADSAKSPHDQGETHDQSKGAKADAVFPTSDNSDGEAPRAVESAENEPFDTPVRTAQEPEPDYEALIVNLDGYAGPLHVLLELARTQKVDLRKLSMVALVDQYLSFVDAAKERRLELAADYLVMASWLAYLKSKLLLPVVKSDDEEPTADEMAARLAFQLQRLEAMRKAAQALQNLPQLGRERLSRGYAEGLRVVKRHEWQASLYDLLQAYAKQRVAAVERTYKPEPPKVFQIEEARERLARLLGAIPDWVTLQELAPVKDVDAPESSVMASAFNAALEFAKDGRIDLRQIGHFEPIYIRPKEATASSGGVGGADPSPDDSVDGGSLNGGTDGIAAHGALPAANIGYANRHIGSHRDGHAEDGAAQFGMSNQ